MLKYEIFDVTEDEAKLNTTIDMDINDLIAMKRLRKVDKDPSYYVRPLDTESIYYLKRPQRRGNSKLSDEHIVKIFRLKAEENLSAFLIGVRLSTEDKVEVSIEAIRNVLARNTYANVEIPSEFMDKVGSAVGTARKKRKSITAEDKPKILKLHDNGNGLSGKQISNMEEFSYSDTTINKFLRKELGYMRDGTRTRK